eukprot:s1539_g22.t1
MELDRNFPSLDHRRKGITEAPCLASDRVATKTCTLLRDSSVLLLDQHHFSIWIPVLALKADFKEMHRRRPGLGLAVTLLLVYHAGFLSAPFVNVSSEASSASSSLARRAAEKRPPPRDMETSLSPEDTYEMPRTPEEEKKMNYWKSDFDDLPAEEKLRSPLVVLGFFLFLTPFIGGFFLLATGGGSDD